ncbi:MAG: hypothetical protein IJQ39_12005 [Thermoguttaceae bacterium]|nr:hypothetical protein [Thermoguttaceae bacterium]
MSEQPVTIEEHKPLPEDCNPTKWNDSYNKNPLLRWSTFGSKEKPPKIHWQTYYRIGAQWLDVDCKRALVVRSKYKSIDFIAMFLRCLNSRRAIKDFSEIYSIDFDQPAIQTNAFENVLTPLILIHFLKVVERIAKRGLKRGYVHREENLKKVKGRIRILANERKNVIPHRFDRVYCQFNEFTVDIPENRLIKRALLFVQRELTHFQKLKYYSQLLHLENKCLSAFTQVSPEIELRDVKLVKTHKLFREYDIAVELAKTILRRNDYSIKKAAGKKKSTPVFWLDMARLFEMYVYSILRKQYGKSILYQFEGTDGETPDFLFRNGDESCILDTKYINLDNVNRLYELVRQLAGYARDVKVLNKLGLSTEIDKTVVPCLFLYPIMENPSDDDGKLLARDNWIEIAGWTKFYKIRVKVPQSPQNEAGE